MPLNILISDILEIFSIITFLVCGIRASIEDVRTLTVSRRLSVTCLVLVCLFHTLSLTAIFYDSADRTTFWVKFWEPARGACIAFILFEAVRLISNRQLGYADVLFAAIGGALLGAIWWLSGAFLACFAGLIWFIVQKDERPLPFIPFLVAGSTIMWILKALRILIQAYR